MDLSPTLEQQELKDAVRRFCQERIAPEQLAAWERDPRGIDRATWETIAGLGWIGLGIGPAAGGSGLGLVEVACLLYECGRGLVPQVVIAAVRGGWALAQLDPEASELAAVATGERTVTLALDEAEGRHPDHFQTRAEARAGTVRLSGAKSFVADGIDADYQIVAAREGGDVSFWLVAGGETQRHALRTFDGERQATIRYEDTRPLRRLSRPGAGRGSLERLRGDQTALALAEMLGGMEAALDMTVAYVKEREQFGQKIAVFQAVQHQVADMATAFTAARHLAWQAITRRAAGTADSTDLAIATAFVAPAFKRVTLAAHHLHGGAGYVVEHPLHWHAERAQALAIRHAPEAPALAQIAAALLD